MRMKDTLMEGFGEREERGIREKEDKVDVYNKELPFSEEIRAKYLLREEQLLADGLPKQKELGKQMHWYRKSNRLALTWGWFIEKNCVSGTGALAAEEECYCIINEILKEQGVLDREDVRMVARIFLWQGSYERTRRYFPFLWEIWKQLPDLLEKMQQDQTNSIEVLTKEGWEFLKEWLEVQEKRQHEDSKKASLYKKMMHCLANGLEKEKRRQGEEIGEEEWRIKHILALEKDFCVDEFCRGAYLTFLFWQYCYARERQRSRRMGKGSGALCKRLLTSMRRVFRPEDNFFRVFFKVREFRYGFERRCITIPVLNEMYEACGGVSELDLEELNDFFWTGSGIQGAALRCARKAGNKDYAWFFQNDFTDEILIWLAIKFRFTNKGGKDFFPVQMYLMQAASEEDLFLIRSRGVFPDETLPRVLEETRQTRDFYKAPLLISWLHGE